MIASVRGEVTVRRTDHVVIECGGVGYRLAVSAHTLRTVPKAGEEALLHTLSAGWPLFLYLGVGPTAVAYALFTAGLTRVPATAAGIVSLLEPLTATTLGLVVFGERLGAVGTAGALLLLLALALLTTARR